MDSRCRFFWIQVWPQIVAGDLAGGRFLDLDCTRRRHAVLCNPLLNGLRFYAELGGQCGLPAAQIRGTSNRSVLDHGFVSTENKKHFTKHKQLLQ